MLHRQRNNKNSLTRSLFMSQKFQKFMRKPLEVESFPKSTGATTGATAYGGWSPVASDIC